MTSQSNPVNSVLTQLLTGKNNETHDIARWLGALAVIIGLALEVYSVVVQGQPFKFQEFGLGMGAVFTGFGAAIKLKENAEP